MLLINMKNDAAAAIETVCRVESSRQSDGMVTYPLKRHIPSHSYSSS